MVQSLAILEYLDEKYPQPPLLPKDLRDRAHVRALAQMLAMDAHPLVVPRVRKYLDEELHLDEAARNAWQRHWMELSCQAFEDVLTRDGRAGQFCFGNEITLADLCLVPHMTNMKMLGTDVSRYPVMARIFDTCMRLEAFSLEAPMQQPDAPKAK